MFVRQWRLFSTFEPFFAKFLGAVKILYLSGEECELQTKDIFRMILNRHILKESYLKYTFSVDLTNLTQYS